MTEEFKLDPNVMPRGHVRYAFWLFAVVVTLVVLGLSPLTFQVDDIKSLFFEIGGALLLFVWSLLWGFSLVEDPPKIVVYPFLGYLAVCVVSTVFAAPFAQWIGWYYCGYYTSALGFVLLGSAVVQSKKMVEYTLKFWLFLAFVTTLFGLFHYAGGLSPTYDFLAKNKLGPEPIRALVYSFKKSREMFSTVLNTQFFGNFLLLLFPVVLSCLPFVITNMRSKLVQKEFPKSSLCWLVIVGFSLIATIVCLLLTYSKSSIGPLVIVIILYIALAFKYGNLTRIPKFPILFLTSMLCISILTATVLYFVWGDLLSRFINISENFVPRKIIYGGAWNMFLDHPVFGGGPGSFRILFPEYRSPDYHLSRVSHLTLYAHDWILDLLAETGLLGFLFYVGFLAAVLFLAYRALKSVNDSTVRIAIIGCATGIIGIFLGSLTTPMSRWPIGTTTIHAMLGGLLGISIFSIRAVKVGGESIYEASPILWNNRRYARVALGFVLFLFLVHTTQRSYANFMGSISHNDGNQIIEYLKISYLTPEQLRANPEVERYLNEAVNDFNRALEFDPARPTTYYKLSHAYSLLQMPDKSLESYKRLQQYAPHYAEIHFNLGVLQTSNAQKQMELADDAYEKKKMDEANDYFLKAKESYLIAIDEFTVAARQSNKVTVHFYLALTMDSFAELLSADEELYRKWKKRAAIAYEKTATLPLTTVTQEEGQSSSELSQRITALANAPKSYGKAGEFILAGKASELYQKELPMAFSILEKTVAYYMSDEDSDDAIRAINDYLTLNPIATEAHLLKYGLLLKLKKYDEANNVGKALLLLDDQMEEGGGESLLSKEEKAKLIQSLKQSK